MGRKKNSLIAVLIVTLAMMAPPAGAQRGKIGPVLGFQKADDANGGNFLFGATFRMELMPILEAEGSINYRKEQFADDALTVRSWPVTVSGLVYVLPFAYGLLGAGWYNTTFDPVDDALDTITEQKFGWHLGAGAVFPLTRKTSAFGDIRYTFIDYDFEELPFEEVDSNFYTIMAGILFGF